MKKEVLFQVGITEKPQDEDLEIFSCMRWNEL